MDSLDFRWLFLKYIIIICLLTRLWRWSRFFCRKKSLVCWVWQYGLWSFQMGGIKLERFIHKNQHTQRKFLNFENWTNGEQKSWLFHSSIIFGAKIEISGTKWVEKHPYIFFYFWFKNKQVWAKKDRKKTKKFQKPKSCRQLP